MNCRFDHACSLAFSYDEGVDFDVITVLGAGTLGAEEALPFSIARSSVRNFK